MIYLFFQRRSDFIFQTTSIMAALSHLHSNSEIEKEVWDPVSRVFCPLHISPGSFFLCTPVKSHRIPEARSSKDRGWECSERRCTRGGGRGKRRPRTDVPLGRPASGRAQLQLSTFQKGFDGWLPAPKG